MPESTSPASIQSGGSGPLAELARRLAESEDRRERTIATLRETEAAYRRLFEFNPIPMWVRDIDSLRILAVNRAAIANYGYSREEFLNLTVLDLLHPDEEPHFRTFLQNLDERTINEGSPDVRHWRHRRKDGRCLTAEIWSHSLVFDGRPSRLVIAHDITERLRAETELRASRERFRQIATATSDAIWEWDFATEQLWWNEPFYSLFGYESATLDHHIDAWSGMVHPDDRDRVVESLYRARSEGCQSWCEEYRFRRADGTYAMVVDRGRVIRAPDGHPERMVGGMSDITEQNRLQTQLLRAQRLESIGTLAGGIAHDLNNTLAPILLSLELLREHCPAPIGRQLISTIETSALRSADLVRQVLAFARGVEGRRRPLELHHLIKEAARLAVETFPAGITVRPQLATDLWTVCADPTQLNQVLLNLSLNARDAMNAGGVLILAAYNVEIARNAKPIHPDAQPGSYVVIEVGDTGHGIAPEHIDRIFEPFFTTKEVGKGTGLGLSTVHAIVREHRGFITVRSTPGQGTVFHVYLPAEPKLVAPKAAAPRTEVSNDGHGRTILVIDDEPAIRDLVCRSLHTHDYQVLCAADGAEGVALFAQNRDQIALVLTDQVMPIMDGTATISALRRIAPSLPIILTSGHIPTSRAPGACDTAPSRFLAKPYTKETLLAAIAECLPAASRA